MVTTERRFRTGDQVQMATTPGAPWTVVADDTDSPHTLDTEPAYALTQTRRNYSRGYDYTKEVVRYAYESDMIPAVASQAERAPVDTQVIQTLR